MQEIVKDGLSKYNNLKNEIIVHEKKLREL
jgi:hypothetical protein